MLCVTADGGLLTLVTITFADILLGVVFIALHILKTKACLVSFRRPVAMPINQVVMGKYIHAVVMPVKDNILLFPYPAFIYNIIVIVLFGNDIK